MLPTKPIIGALALLLASVVTAQETPVTTEKKLAITVPATANIFAAGQSTSFSGTLPPVVQLTPGSFCTVEFAAAGFVTLGGDEPYSGPHGIPFFSGTNLASIDGISGIIDYPLGFFLTGVFLDDSTPSGNGPAILNFTDHEDFTVLKPLLFQTFYIGTGFTGITHQVFVVPPHATRLFLGISDGCVLDSGGPPGCYNDNVGTFYVSVALR